MGKLGWVLVALVLGASVAGAFMFHVGIGILVVGLYILIGGHSLVQVDTAKKLQQQLKDEIGDLGSLFGDLKGDVDIEDTDNLSSRCCGR